MDKLLRDTHIQLGEVEADEYMDETDVQELDDMLALETRPVKTETNQG